MLFKRLHDRAHERGYLLGKWISVRVLRVEARIFPPTPAEQERDYLLRWLGGWQHNKDTPEKLTGASADNLTCIAFGVKGDGAVPHDMGDLGRCERAFDAMPPHIQQRALPDLEQWQRDIRRLTNERGW